MSTGRRFSSTPSSWTTSGLIDGSLRQQLEGPERAALRHVDEVWVGLADIDAAGAACDRHVLHTVALPRHGLADDPGRCLELPDDLAVVRVDRDELAGQRTGEHEAARGDERARPVRALEAGLPFGFAGHRVDRLQI